MTVTAARHVKRPSRPRFPALRAFVAAYWHEDMREEHGSAAGAVRAFARDATPDELAKLRDEWDRWQALHAEASVEAKQAALRRLGSAWQPQRDADLTAVRKVLG
jgi:hypothetical protein